MQKELRCAPLLTNCDARKQFHCSQKVVVDAPFQILLVSWGSLNPAALIARSKNGLAPLPAITSGASRSTLQSIAGISVSAQRASEQPIVAVNGDRPEHLYRCLIGMYHAMRERGASN